MNHCLPPLITEPPTVRRSKLNVVHSHRWKQTVSRFCAVSKTTLQTCVTVICVLSRGAYSVLGGATWSTAGPPRMKAVQAARAAPRLPCRHGRCNTKRSCNFPAFVIYNWRSRSGPPLRFFCAHFSALARHPTTSNRSHFSSPQIPPTSPACYYPLPRLPLPHCPR